MGDADSDSTKTEFWGLFEVPPEKEDAYAYDKKDTTISVIGSDVFGECKCSHNIHGKTIAVLQMTSSYDREKKVFREFLERIQPHVKRKPIVYKPNRRITGKGKEYLENRDISLPTGIYMEFVKDGYPLQIIREIVQMDEKRIKCIDLSCRRRGYVKVGK